MEKKICSNVVEDVSVSGIRLWKCPKYNYNISREILFIFHVQNFKYTSRPGPLIEAINVCPDQNIRVPMDSTCFHNQHIMDKKFELDIIEVVKRANMFIYDENDDNVAREIIRYIRSCYRFSECALSITSDRSLVFFVEAVRTCASKQFVEAKKLLLPSVDMETLVRIYEGPSVVNAGKEDSINVGCLFGDWLVDSDYDPCGCYVMRRMLRGWQQLRDGIELHFKLTEVKPLIDYKILEWKKVGNEYVTIASDQNRAECVICLGSYDGKIKSSAKFPWEPELKFNELVKLSCGHLFHHRCIFKWLETKPTCPLCKTRSYVIV